MTKPTKQPLTIPGLKRRIRRKSITIAACAAAIGLAIIVGAKASQQPPTRVPRHNITIPALLRDDTAALKKDRALHWHIVRIGKNNEPKRLWVYPADSLVNWPMSTQIEYAGIATLRPQPLHIGLMVPWLNYRSHSINIRTRANPQNPPTESELAKARSMVISDYGNPMNGDPGWYDRLNAGDGYTWSIRPHLLLIDLAALAAIPLGLISLTLTLKHYFLLQRLIRKECPKCRYNLAGIEHQATNCPECGQSLMLTPNANAAPSEQP